MPDSLHYQQVGETIQLKWKYDANILKHIKSLSNDEHQSTKVLKTSTESFFFHLYLNKTAYGRVDQSTTPAVGSYLLSSTTLTPNRHNSLAQYRVINAFNATSKTDANMYEFNLTNLIPDGQYMFFLSARYDLLESPLAGPISVRGPGKTCFSDVLKPHLIMLMNHNGHFSCVT
jgi:hypothetical protein